MAVAVAGVAFMIYPILKRYADTTIKQGLAVWYVGTRITEGTVFVVAVLATLALLSLSQEFVQAGAPNAPFYLAGGSVLLATVDYAFMLGQSVFCIGALMLYYLLFESKIVPRWLSVWGFIAAPLMFVCRPFTHGDRRSKLNVFNHFVCANGLAGDGLCSVADRQGV